MQAYTEEKEKEEEEGGGGGGLEREALWAGREAGTG